MTTTLILIICATSILLMLVRPKKIAEIYWVGGGALLLLLLRLMPLRQAARAVADGSDVYLFLLGMMILSELARENGVFDWVASLSVRTAQGSCTRLFALIYVVGIVVTVCLSNDATAVVLTPAVLAAVRKAKAQPLPFLFACAMIANAASFVLPISNPANLVVFRTGMPSLGAWLAAFAVPSLLSIATTFAVLRFVFRKELRCEIEQPQEAAVLTHGGRLVLWGLGVVVLVLLAASALKMDLGLPTCVAALCVTAVASLAERSNPLPLLRQISWQTLGLVAALFVLVNAVESVGALRFAESALHAATGHGVQIGAVVAACVVAVANNVVNNLPLGLIAGSTLAATHTHGLVAHAVLIGVDLGPNLSITGSLATILWLLALRREGVRVTGAQFLRVGVVVMPAALLASMVGALAMQAMLH
ncbi:MAG: ArsB/NhaD family transporter [Acidobacteriaceae bacterium]|nr:ArsB/NhaD family transporter [Acidobacteriaceae bacterium]